MWASPHWAQQACGWRMDEGRESCLGRCTGAKPKMDGELPEGKRGLHLCFSWGFIKVCDISARSDSFSFIRKSPEGLRTGANCTCQEIDDFSQQPLPGAICHLSLSSIKDLEAVPAISLALALHRHQRPCFLLPWGCRRSGGKAGDREWACQPQVPGRELKRRYGIQGSLRRCPLAGRGRGEGAFFDVTEPLHPCSLQLGLRALNNKDDKEAGSRPVLGPQKIVSEPKHRIPFQTHSLPLSHVCGPDIYGLLHPSSLALSPAGVTSGRHQENIEGQRSERLG